ncbi:hypothetical protein BDV95DRAFT_470141, partial [Massariosphaeria phaeospora]
MSSPPILRLPVELYGDIIDQLDLQDRIRLAWTSRYFTSIIAFPTYDEFLEAETRKWAMSKSLFACSICARFQRLEAFADDMRKNKRGRFGAEARTRYCLRCGVDRGWYSIGAVVTVMGQRMALCQPQGTSTD